jgi:HTH-type transcriptional regulator / antitoxin HigA
METVNAFRVSPNYTNLLSRIPPKIIRTELENEQYTQALYELEHRPEALSAEEEELAELLTLIIEDFEERQHRLPHASPAEALAFLIDEHGLAIEDLSDVLRSPRDILSGQRTLTTDEIRRLSDRFHVSPELFF